MPAPTAPESDAPPRHRDGAPPTAPAAGGARVDFGDTATAFAHQSDADLRHARRLFRFMNHPRLVAWASAIGTFAVRHGLPLAERLTLATIYRQFVGGRTLLEVEAAARALAEAGVLSVLDYGAEGTEDERGYNRTMTECIRAIEFAGQSAAIPVVSTKLTGLCANGLLEALTHGASLDEATEREHGALLKRVDSLCHVAAEHGVQLYVDAEESWLQDAIDHVVLVAMKRYNRERAVIANTYQLYRRDRLGALHAHHAACRAQGVVLGAKLVRGAYMAKERAHAAATGRPDPIQPSKAATDHDFDLAVAYCLDHVATIEFVNASHNQASALKMIEGMHARGIAPDHPHAMFCQLYGMSDNMTYNLAAAGHRVGKYLPYGPVREVVPYLVRRAQENTSVTGEASRELQLLERELARRRGRGRRE